MDALTHEGEGVVRGGKTAFIAGALPGELVRFRRTGITASTMTARCSRCSSLAAQRVTPRCAHFGVCGGCALQHLDPQAQLAAKEAELRDVLARVGQVTPARWLAPLAGPVWAYRRRARLGVKFVRKKGRVLVGFRERAAPYVAALERCEVLAEPAGSLIAPLAAHDRHPRASASSCRRSRSQSLTMPPRWCCGCWRPPHAEDRAKLAGFAAAHGVQFFLQSGGDSVPWCRLRDGGAPLYYALDDFGLACSSRPPTSSRSMRRSMRRWFPARCSCWSWMPHRACWTFSAGWATSPWHSRGARSLRSGWRGRPASSSGPAPTHVANGIANAAVPRGQPCRPGAGRCLAAAQLQPRAAGPAAHRRARGAGPGGRPCPATGVVYFLPPREPGTRSWGVGERTRHEARGGRCSRHVPAYHPR